MTIRTPLFAVAVLGAILVGAAAVTVAVVPTWKSETETAAIDRTRLAGEVETLERRLDDAVAQAAQAHTDGRTATDNLQKQLNAAGQDIQTWRAAYDRLRENADAATRQAGDQIAALAGTLRQTQEDQALAAQRGTQLESQLLATQGQYRTDTAALTTERDRAAAERDRALADLARTQRDANAFAQQANVNLAAAQQNAQVARIAEQKLDELRRLLRDLEQRERAARTELDRTRDELRDRREEAENRQLRETVNRLEKENRELKQKVADLQAQLNKLNQTGGQTDTTPTGTKPPRYGDAQPGRPGMNAKG